MTRTAAPVLDIEKILLDESSRIVVVCGAGGVGKTTTAASMALRAAESAARLSFSPSTLRVDSLRRWGWTSSTIRLSR